MKTINLCISALMVFLACQVNAQEGCNLVITIGNSNCNDNTLVAGKGGAGSCDSSDCVACGDCCECLEARFESTFQFPNLVTGSVTIIPFLQGPNCSTAMGDPVVFSDSNARGVGVCLKECLRCEGHYQLGYYIEPADGADTSGAVQTVNRDSICACGQSCPLPSVAASVLTSTVSEVFVTKVIICCVDCLPPPPCGGCSCLNTSFDDNVLPGAN